MNDVQITCAARKCPEHITIDPRHASNFEGRRWSCLNHRRRR